jgi:DNA repair exonuclease SbcCD ATPase subunit
MPEALRILDVSIEGFRGINKKVTFNFDRKSAVLYGPNGAGKTSVLQAIEWCLFGELASAYIEGTEFKKEDAIVNPFNPNKKAIVELTMEDQEGKKIKVSRKRKMGRSTTAGKAELDIEIDGAEYSSKDAQAHLNQTLKLIPAEFYAGVYLHQEAIRDMIVGDPLLRSEVIDKLLGLHYVRELIDYIPLKHVTKESKTLEEEIKDIRDRKMLEVAVAKKRLAELEIELEKVGIEKTSLTTTFLIDLTEKSNDQLLKIAGEMGVKIKEIKKPQAEVGSLVVALDELKERIEKLERHWATSYKEGVQQVSSLQSLQRDYGKSLEEFSKLEIQDPKILLTKKDEIARQISKLQSDLQTKMSSRKFLQGEFIIIQGLHSNLRNLQETLGKIQHEYGDEATIERTLSKLLVEIEEKKRSIKKEEALNSLLVSGLNYLKGFITNNCPLCLSDIDYEKVLSRLQEDIGRREGAKLLQKLQTELEGLNEKRRQHEEALTSIKRYRKDLEDVQSKVEDMKKRLKDKGFAPEDPLLDYISNKLEELDGAIRHIDEGTRAMKSEETQIGLRLQDLQSKTERLTTLEKQIQKTITTTETGEELLETLKAKVDEMNLHMTTLEKQTDNLKAIRSQMETFEKILAFLKEKSRAEELEKGLPLLQQRLNDLQEKYAKIKELEAGLTDIHQAAVLAREDMVKRTLSLLQSTISSYYAKILCHPYYLNLQLIPEEERGKAIYRLRAWDKDFKQGTYVQTRFSNAQMNAVALSLFLSMATKMPSNAGFILLDDPTQSMDLPHKEALAKLISEISSEKQVFIATQDGEFQESLRKHLPEAKTRTYNFKEWRPEGPQIEHART